MGRFLVDLGVEPPIEASGRRHAAFDRRRVSLRWLMGTVLTGMAGAALIGSAIYAALDRQAVFPQAPDYVVSSSTATSDAGDALGKGDRLVKAADIVAEKQTFRAPVTVAAGDKQVIRMRGFTHVSTTLTLASTGLADQVPEFNPLKLLAGDEPTSADAPIDPGRLSTRATSRFTTRDLS